MPWTPPEASQEAPQWTPPEAHVAEAPALSLPSNPDSKAADPIDRWHSLFTGGLENINLSLTGPQMGAMDLVDRHSDNPADGRARSINQAYISERAPSLAGPIMDSNWETVKQSYAKHELGIDAAPMGDTALFSAIGKHYENGGAQAVANANAFRGAGPLDRAKMIFSWMTKYGVKKAEENAAEFLGDAPRQIGKSFEPAAPFPKAPDDLPNLPGLGVSNPAFLAGVWNGVKPMVDGLLSPGGIATLGIGAGLKAGATAGVPMAKASLLSMEGLFTGIMGYQLVKGAPDKLKVINDPKASFQDKVAAGSGLMADGTMTLLGAAGTALTAMPPAEATAMLTEMKGATPAKAAEIMRAKIEETPDSPHNDLLNDAAREFDKIAKVIPEKETTAAAAEPSPLVPLPDNAQVTTMEMGGKRAVQITIPDGDGEHPAFSGSVEDAKAQGYDVAGVSELPAGETTVGEVSQAEKASAPQKEILTGIKNEAVDSEMEKMGLPDTTHGEKVTFAGELTKAKDILGKDPTAAERLIEQVKSEPRPLTSTEDALLLHEMNKRRIEREAAETALKEAEKGQDAPAIKDAMIRAQVAAESFHEAAEASTQAGTKNAQALALRRMMMREDYSLASMETQLRRAKGGEALDSKETAKVRELSERVAKAETALEEFQRNKRAAATTDLNRPPKTPARSFLADQAKSARERIKLRMSEGRVSSGLDPQDLLDHAIIGADYLARGVTDLAKWSKAMVGEFGDKISGHLDEIRKRAEQLHDNATKERAIEATKERLARSTKKLDERIKNQDIAKPKRADLKLDEEGLRLQAENNRAKEDFQRLVKQHELANQGTAQKVATTFARWRRGFLLSSPTTLVKLSAAAVWRMGFSPVEEAVGGVLSHLPVISRVADLAPREGHFSANAEINAITEAVTIGMRDAWDMLRTGDTRLSQGPGHTPGKISLADVMPRAAIDFFGNIHGALKSPVKRSEFARSFAKRMEFYADKGLDPKDPELQARVSVEAYKDSNRAIFMQDNMAVDAYKRALSRFQQVDKTGKPSAAGLAASTAMQAALPIVKIPTNIVGEIFTYAGGTLSGSTKLAVTALTKGIDKLQPEEADMIMRHMKKGLVGSALMLYGYFNSDQFGGYYQHGQKRGKDDVKPKEAKFLDHDIPSSLMHNPAIEQMQIGASLARIGESKLHKHDKEQQGLPTAALSTALGIAEEVPFAREAVEVGKLFDPNERQYAAGDLLKSIMVPAVVDWAARHMDTDESGDPVKRKPTSVMEHVKSGIPGLREELQKAKR